MTPSPPPHQIVDRREWLQHRRELLEAEKDLTRRYDRICAQRRALPWVRIDQRYLFQGPDGQATLADLFRGRSQLIIQHFMFGPGWGEGCVGCSFGADHVDGALVHLENHDVAYAAVSRAPWAEIAPFRQRMGWRFPWYSSSESEFNVDFGVSFPPELAATGRVHYNYRETDFLCEEMSGTSVFYRDEAGTIYHTYSTYARGGELAVGAFVLLDLTPKGRNETGPRGNLTDWVRHHDRYQTPGSVAASGRATPAAAPAA